MALSIQSSEHSVFGALWQGKAFDYRVIVGTDKSDDSKILALKRHGCLRYPPTKVKRLGGQFVQDDAK